MKAEQDGAADVIVQEEVSGAKGSGTDVVARQNDAGVEVCRRKGGWDVGASEETAVAALPQFLQPSSVVAAVWGDVAPLALPHLPSFCWHSHPCCGVRALPCWKPRSHLLWLGLVSVPWAPGVTAGAPAWAQMRRWRRVVSDG